MSKTKAVALLAFVLASVSVSVPVRAVPRFIGPSTLQESTAESLWIMQAAAWKLACEAKMITECNRYAPPMVTYAILFNKLGQYRIGSEEIVVELRLLGQPTSVLIMVHEMIHYIQNLQGWDDKDGPNSHTWCQSEDEAFTLTRAINDKYNITDDEVRLPSWESMKGQYGCYRVPFNIPRNHPR